MTDNLPKIKDQETDEETANSGVITEGLGYYRAKASTSGTKSSEDEDTTEDTRAIPGGGVSGVATTPTTPVEICFCPCDQVRAGGTQAAMTPTVDTRAQDRQRAADQRQQDVIDRIKQRQQDARDRAKARRQDRLDRKKNKGGGRRLQPPGSGLCECPCDGSITRAGPGLIPTDPQPRAVDQQQRAADRQQARDDARQKRQDQRDRIKARQQDQKDAAKQRQEDRKKEREKRQEEAAKQREKRQRDRQKKKNGGGRRTLQQVDPDGLLFPFG